MADSSTKYNVGKIIKKIPGTAMEQEKNCCNRKFLVNITFSFL
jgi:hypothetical protein